MDGGYEVSVRVDVLGPLRLLVDGVAVQVRGPKRRGVLALLVLAEGRAVTVDHLADSLWPDAVPESGRQALHSLVSRLRGHLGPSGDRLQTLDGAYRLVLDSAEVDLRQARELLAEARAVAEPEPARACERLRRARELWRGPVLADLLEITPVAAAVVAVEALAREVDDQLVGCAIAAGELDRDDRGRIVELARAAVAADPLREQAVALLMRALAAGGRASEALQTGRDYRRRLAEEAGLDPSAGLGELERDIAVGAVGAVGAAGAGDRTRAAAASTISPAGPLIGREDEVAALDQVLATERLVTVVGPGGVGKTRVALEVADRAGDRIAAVLLLAPVTDAATVPHALAAALQLRVTQGDVLRACAAVLGDRDTLLVLDNCEHLLAAVRDLVAALLAACPRLTVLATSRQPLGLPVERAQRLSPLPVPRAEHQADALSRVASVAVFLDRAARSRADAVDGARSLQRVAEIVRRLDGIPLAIELAAGRMSTLSLDDLQQRLDRALDLLGGARPSADARHRTLRATVEWSYQLLDEQERRLFEHLSVFVDGVDLDTAEQVAADLGLTGDPGTLLARLVDASMIDATFAGRTRYRMLETLRLFGLDQLARSGETDAAQRRLLRWATTLTAWIDAVATTDREPDGDAALRREIANLRAAWQLARRHDTLDDAVALAISLYEIGEWRDLTELWAWPEELADTAELLTHPGAAQVLGAAAEVAYMRGNYPLAEQRARDGLELAVDPAGSWICLNTLAVAELSRGAFDEVVHHSVAAAALARRPTEDFGVAALAATYAGEIDQARGLHARMTAIAGSPTHRGFLAYVAGEIDNATRSWGQAVEHYRAAITLGRESGATFLVGIASVGLVTALSVAGRDEDALHGYREVIDYWDNAGNWTHQWTTLRNLARLLRRLGDHDTATLLDGAADRAPDAPRSAPGADPRPAVPATSGHPPIGRREALALARRAIHAQLGR